MSKTIMIADETYGKLKRMKETRKMSFTQAIETLFKKDDRVERNRRLMELQGTGTYDPVDEARVKQILKEGWKKWNEKYVSTRI